MKKIIMLSMVILCLPLVYSVIYGGETVRYLFDECDELRVNITADELDNREYVILNDCTEEETNYWVCGCYDHYYFDVSFKANAKNEYTIYFNYDYSRMITKTSGNGGGSSRGGGFYDGSYWKSKFENKTATIEELEEIVEELEEDEEIPPEVIEELEEIIESVKEDEKEGKSVAVYWVLGIIIVVIVGAASVFLWRVMNYE